MKWESLGAQRATDIPADFGSDLPSWWRTESAEVLGGRMFRMVRLVRADWDDDDGEPLWLIHSVSAMAFVPDVEP